MAGNDTNAIILEVANRYGLDPDYLRAMGGIESKHNTFARNSGSNARGLFQFIPSTWRKYGRGADPYDPRANADAAARFTLDNIKHFKGAMGRDPTHGEMYLMHQQGPGGAVALLQGGDTPAADILGYRAIHGNVPAHVRHRAQHITSKNFADSWMKRAEDRVARYRNAIPRDVVTEPLAPPEGATASNKPLSETPTLKELNPASRPPLAQPPYDVASTMKMIFPDTANTPKPAAAQGLQQQTPTAASIGPLRTASMAPQPKTPKIPRAKVSAQDDIADSIAKDIRTGNDDRARSRLHSVSGKPVNADYTDIIEAARNARSPTEAAKIVRDSLQTGGGKPAALSPSEKIAADSIAKSDGGKVTNVKTRPSTPAETAVPGGEPGARFDPATGAPRSEMPNTPRTYGAPGRTYNDFVQDQMNAMNAGRVVPSGVAPTPATGGGGGRSVVPYNPSGGGVAPSSGSGVVPSSGGGAAGAARRSIKPMDQAVAGGVIAAGSYPRGSTPPPVDSPDAVAEVEPGEPGSMRGSVGGPSIDDTGGLGSPGVPQAPNTNTPGGGVYPGFTTDKEEAARRRSVNRAGKGSRGAGPSQGDQLMNQMVEQALGLAPGTLNTPQGQAAANAAIEIVKQRVAQDPGLAKAALSKAAETDAAATTARRAAPPPPTPMPQPQRQRQATDYGGSPTSSSDRMTDLAAQNPGMAQLFQFFTGGQGGQ